MRKVAVVFGTRPEAIKLAPVIHQLHQSSGARPIVIATGQHRELLSGVLEFFDIAPSHAMDTMRPGQSLAELTSRLLVGLDKIFAAEQPDAVLVQGDTNTACAASLAAFYRQIAVGHVEAGLRSFDLSSPWPEEGNRLVASCVSSMHFAPTAQSRRNLEAAGVQPGSIFVTGNTVTDALLLALRLNEKRNGSRSCRFGVGRKLVLVTAHRRESFGEPLRAIMKAIRELAEKYTHECDFVLPVHPNPQVRDAAAGLAAASLNNVFLIDPVPYSEFVQLLEQSYLVLTDSGGIQEEAPTLGKPVLVMRDNTERPEGIEAGTARLVGTETAAIVAAVSELVESRTAYQRMAHATNPYGDGHAAERIVDICLRNGARRS